MSGRWKMSGGRVLVMAFGVAVLFTLAAQALALGTEPQDHVKETIEAITAVLKGPQGQAADRERERKHEVRRIIHEAFDFRDMSREVLGPQWAKLTPEQQEEFTRLFGELFERSYNRLILRYLGERRTIYGDTSVENGRALVQTTLVSRTEAKLPVDYRLDSDGRRWAIYDVVIDGVSLSMNYRAQFTKILRTSSYESLVQRIKDKIAEERL